MGERTPVATNNERGDNAVTATVAVLDLDSIVLAGTAKGGVAEAVLDEEWANAIVNLAIGNITATRPQRAAFLGFFRRVGVVGTHPMVAPLHLLVRRASTK